MCIRDSRHTETVLKNARCVDSQEGAGVQTPQQPLRTEDVQETGQDGSGNRPNAADDHNQQNLIGHGALEGRSRNSAHTVSYTHLEDLPVRSVEILSCRGLTSFYAMQKGLILGF